MSVEVTNVQRLRMDVEAAGSFAVDGTGTLANFRDVPFVEGSISATANQVMLNPETGQQRLDAYPTQLIGIKDCSLSFSMNLAPTGTAAGAATVAVQSVLGEILKATMGGENLGTGSTVNTANATARSILVGSESGLPRGTAMGWVNSTSVLEAREIRATSGGGLLTLKRSLSAAPAQSDPIYGSASYYLTQDPDTSLQFILEGAENHDAWTFRGCQGGMSFEFPMGEIPRVTFNLQGVDWDQADGSAASANLTGASVSAATYSNVAPIHTVGRFHFVDMTATAAPTAVNISDFTFTPNLTYVPVPSPSASASFQHVTTRWRRNRAVPVATGSFTTYFEDDDYWDDRASKQMKACTFQMGTTAGNCVFFTCPTVQITDVQRVDAGGIAAQQVTFECLEDAYVSGADSDLEFSAFRIHFL